MNGHRKKTCLDLDLDFVITVTKFLKAKKIPGLGTDEHDRCDNISKVASEFPWKIILTKKNYERTINGLEEMFGRGTNTALRSFRYVQCFDKNIVKLYMFRNESRGMKFFESRFGEQNIVVTRNGIICLHCYSSDVEADYDEEEGGVSKWNVHCNDCHKRCSY